MCIIFSCKHNHEHSETMKKVIDINVKMWEDIEVTKKQIKESMSLTARLSGGLDSLSKAKISSKLINLASQEQKINELHELIPEIEGYEPKCSHEPGEAHVHSNVDINGMSEEELLSIHKELRDQLDKIKKAVAE